MTDKVVNISVKNPNVIAQKTTIELNKISLLKVLSDMEDLVRNNEIMSIAISASYYNGASCNSYYIPSNGVAVIGELECLKQRIMQQEIDIV